MLAKIVKSLSASAPILSRAAGDSKGQPEVCGSAELTPVWRRAPLREGGTATTAVSPLTTCTASERRWTLHRLGSLYNGYKYSVAYIFLIVLLNTLFTYVPLTTVFGSEVSPMDWTVGVVYVLRDFAQRELQHKVILAMLVGSILSFVLAERTLAIASMSAFLIAEFVDWAVYTFTRRPLSQRILWSASLSAPIDSALFLAVIHQLNGWGVAILASAKIAGVFMVWFVWYQREQCMKQTISLQKI